MTFINKNIILIHKNYISLILLTLSLFQLESILWKWRRTKNPARIEGWGLHLDLVAGRRRRRCCATVKTVSRSSNPNESQRGEKEIKCQLWKWVYENRDDVAEEHVSYCDDDDGSNPRGWRIEELQLLLSCEEFELRTTHVPNWTIERLNDCWRLDDWRIDFPSIIWIWLDFVVRLLRMMEGHFQGYKPLCSQNHTKNK